MRLTTILFAICLLATGVFGQQNLREGSTAPNFSATSLDGKTYDMNSLRGKIVLVTFWSTRCGICHAEIPKLNQIASRYKSQDVVFLALTMENEAKIESYIRKTPFNFHHLPNSFGVVLQYADRGSKGNLNMGFPAHYLIGPDGTIRLKTSGFAKSAQIDSEIAEMLTSRSGHSTAAASQR